MEPAPPPPKVDRVGRGLVVLTSAPVLVVLLGELPDLHWTLDLLRHFAFQSLVSLLGCALLLVLAGRRKTAMLAGLLALLPAAQVLPLWRAPATKGAESANGADDANGVEITNGAASAPRLRVATINLLASNRAIERAARWLEATDPDVVALLEFTPAHEKALAPLRARWPFATSKTVESPFGIALWSKTELRDAEVFAFGATWSWAVRATVTTAIGEVGVLAIHPPPPMVGEYASDRDRALRSLAEETKGLPPLRLVLGDANATRWSRAFEDGVAAAGLRDSSEGFGFQGSWPTGLPWFLRVPIDHVLVSDGLAVVRRELGAEVGSDHLPVVTEVIRAAK